MVAVKNMRLLLLAGCSFWIMEGCRKTAPEQPSNQPTPYTLQIPRGLPKMQIPPDNPLTVEGVALGKKLFFDPLLSGDNTMACADCHRQQFAFTDSSLRLSKGINGLEGTRNAMPLVNLGWQRSFFWDGGAANLESQVIGPIENPLEMHQDLALVVDELNSHPEYPGLFRKAFGSEKITLPMVMKAVAQFERTLISGNAEYDKFTRGEAQLSAQELRGLQLYTDMNKGDCNHCHVLGSTFSDFEFRNTGLDSIAADQGRALITNNPTDNGKFKTPSLRNIALTAPYMHDGRFATLLECVAHYNTGFHYSNNLDASLVNITKDRMTLQEMEDIVAFLQTLTDHEFINNPQFKQ